MIDFTTTDGVAEVVLNNPQAMNALDPQALADLDAAYAEATRLAAEGTVRALILRGEGRGFCAGRNIAGLNPADDDATYYLDQVVTPVLKNMTQVPVPTFAAVQGACLGVGLGLAIATDIVYVADTAKIGSPFANLGATLDSGGHFLFAERLGAHRAMDLIVTGELMSGADAVRAGLFSRSVPADELLEFTRAKAQAAARGATLAFRASREQIRLIREQGLGLWESIARENIAQGELCASADYHEGFAAFNAKRPPVFHGR
ncbi:crotonase [Corynebacterium sp. 13CS0277]|uniref:enoyl-CoA hydratase/isomerase family protein n=1 Tax=Corynebacterium sp. 13CS0277 TaxID=2071994 RepID=UPI000D03AB3D|nr:enoyl-CoA hydratase/isomerase family protein [Corynebacterium sp. 13CS0277]PRQ11266.1 crotonase [Corynebacterium sp. 13CS0277]